MWMDFNKNIDYVQQDKIEESKISISDLNTKFKEFIKEKWESISYNDVTNFYKNEWLKPVWFSESDIWTGENEFFYKYSKDWILYSYEKWELVELKKEWQLFIEWEYYLNINGEYCDKNWKTERLYRNNINEEFEIKTDYEIYSSHWKYKYMSSGSSIKFAKEWIFSFKWGEVQVFVDRKEYSLNDFKEYLNNNFKKTWEWNLEKDTIENLENKWFNFNWIIMSFPENMDWYLGGEKKFKWKVEITEPTPKSISYRKEWNKYIFNLDFWDWDPTALEVY